jgi:hypothetical protein
MLSSSLLEEKLMAKPVDRSIGLYTMHLHLRAEMEGWEWRSWPMAE